MAPGSRGRLVAVCQCWFYAPNHAEGSCLGFRDRLKKKVKKKKGGRIGRL